MTVKVSINGSQYPVFNAMSFSERRDEEMDSGSVQILCTRKEPFPDYTFVKMTISDGENKKVYDFYAFDNVEQRRSDYFVHTLELVELSRLLMGVLIDGKTVTQPIEGTNEKKKNLYEVLDDVLSAASLLKSNADNSSVGKRFSPYASASFKAELERIDSPEFHWSAGTLLWECLCDIGKVIDSIPRLLAPNGETDLRVTFDKINDVTGEYSL